MHLMYSPKAGSSHSIFTQVLAMGDWTENINMLDTGPHRRCGCCSTGDAHLRLTELGPQLGEESQVQRETFISNQDT